jgi:hypothetical protein
MALELRRLFDKHSLTPFVTPTISCEATRVPTFCEWDPHGGSKASRLPLLFSGGPGRLRLPAALELLTWPERCRILRGVLSYNR